MNIYIKIIISICIILLTTLGSAWLLKLHNKHQLIKDEGEFEEKYVIPEQLKQDIKDEYKDIKDKCKIIDPYIINNLPLKIEGQKEEIEKSQYKIFISICDYINKYILEEIFDKYTYEMLIFYTYQNIFIADNKVNKIKYLLKLGQKININNIDENLIITLNNINDINDIDKNLMDTIMNNISDIDQYLLDLSGKTEDKEMYNILVNIIGYNSYLRTEKDEYNDYVQFNIKYFIDKETRISKKDYNNFNDYLSTMIDIIESILLIHYNNYHSVYNKDYIEIYNKLHPLKGQSITDIISVINYDLINKYKKITGDFNILLLLYCMHYKDSSKYIYTYTDTDTGTEFSVNKFNESKDLIKNAIIEAINLSIIKDTELEKYNLKLSNNNLEQL